MEKEKALSGSLTIVGTGIQFLTQITVEARAHIEQAEKVLFLVADPATVTWIMKLNPTAESLEVYYSEDKDRLTTYLEMVERILSCVREGLKVCVAFYGHPGIFVNPSHEAIRRARLEGFSAQMLPGISAEDCLFADLGVDPGETGCQSFEATDFLIYKRKFDSRCSLVLWQIGVIGDFGYKNYYDLHGLRILVEVLMEHYDANHEVVIYEAAQYPVCSPVIERIPLVKVPESRVIPLSTLYIPPKISVSVDLNMIDRLGIPRSSLRKNLPER